LRNWRERFVRYERGRRQRLVDQTAIRQITTAQKPAQPANSAIGKICSTGGGNARAAGVD
jgi:hypothetical protein